MNRLDKVSKMVAVFNFLEIQLYGNPLTPLWGKKNTGQHDYLKQLSQSLKKEIGLLATEGFDDVVKEVPSLSYEETCLLAEDPDPDPDFILSEEGKKAVDESKKKPFKEKSLKKEPLSKMTQYTLVDSKKNVSKSGAKVKRA